MRIKRDGDQWTQSYSFDGENWTSQPSFTHILTVTGLGPYSGNAVGAGSPAHTTSIDYFFNTASPIIPEDDWEPVAVFLQSFAAEREDSRAILHWVISYTTKDHLGFHIYRGRSGETRDRITSQPVTGGLEYEFVDATAPTGQVDYWLMEVNGSGEECWYGPASLTEALGASPGYALKPNYPNPFNPETKINYEIRERGWVQLTIYDAQGRMVRTLVNEEKGAGQHSAAWNGRNTDGSAVSSGVYFVRLESRSSGQVKSRKIILLK